MSYIKFSPSILIDNDEIDESVLWKSGYKVYDSSLVDSEMINFLNKRIDLAYPLSYWEDCIDSWTHLIKHKNFPFKKSFYILNNKGKEVCNGKAKTNKSSPV